MNKDKDSQQPTQVVSNNQRDIGKNHEEEERGTHHNIHNNKILGGGNCDIENRLHNNIRNMTFIEKKSIGKVKHTRNDSEENKKLRSSLDHSKVNFRNQTKKLSMDQFKQNLQITQNNQQNQINLSQ